MKVHQQLLRSYKSRLNIVIVTYEVTVLSIITNLVDKEISECNIA